MKNKFLFIAPLLLLLIVPILIAASSADTQGKRLVQQLVFDSDGKWISGSYDGFLETKRLSAENDCTDNIWWYISDKNISEFSKNVKVGRRNDMFGMPESITLEEIAYGLSIEEFATFWCYKNPEDTFFDGLARYWQGSRWTSVKMGYLDKTGRFITPPIYDYAENYSEGLAAVGIGNMLEPGDFKAGFIDQSGNIAIPMIYDFAGSFINGIAYVSIDGEWRYINKSGEFVIPTDDEISQPYDDASVVTHENGAAVDVLTVVSQAGSLVDVIPNNYSVIDSKGNVILPMEYDYISILDDGYVMAQKGNLNILFYDTMYSNGVGIAVTVNGSHIDFDQVPIMENDRVLVPFRKIFEVLGAIVDWNGETQTVTAKKGDTEISLKIGSNVLNKNSEEIILDVPAKIVNDRTLVPIRAVSEGLGARVEWDETAQAVLIWTN